jgi:predicted SAM-dependent methyltransferase
MNAFDEWVMVRYGETFSDEYLFDNDMVCRNYEPFEFIEQFLGNYLNSVCPQEHYQVANIGSGVADQVINTPTMTITNFDYLLDGVDIKTALFNEAQEKYDVVTSTRLFEHIPICDMTELLYACYSVLKPNGYICIAVPDFDIMSELFYKLDNYENWFQRYNILNSIVYHSIEDEHGVLLDSHKTVWNKSILEGFLTYEDNFEFLESITPIKISKQQCYIVGIGKKL